jgi:hypothetical protein
MKRPLSPPSVSTVRLVVVASVVVTLFHFTDNYVSIETYPEAGWQPDWFDVVVLVSWPLFTAFGVVGYLLYRRGQLATAHACLIVYSYTGLSSLGHFLYGSPDEFTTRGLVSVFTDVLAGSAVLAVTVWSIVAHRRRAAASGRASVEARTSASGG